MVLGMLFENFKNYYILRYVIFEFLKKVLGVPQPTCLVRVHCETASDEAASIWQTGNRILQVTETVGKTTVCCRAVLNLVELASECNMLNYTKLNQISAFLFSLLKCKYLDIYGVTACPGLAISARFGN